MEGEISMSGGLSSFLIIGFTLPTPHESPEVEAEAINDFLLSDAVDIFHIRKTESSAQYTEDLLNLIDPSLATRLVLNSHYHLTDKFSFKGIHYKPQVHKDYEENFFISRSCHHISELNQGSDAFLYSFLSPIYDSISKVGYSSAFSLKEKDLQNAVASCPVIALGGVQPSFFYELFQSKFAGAALLGYLWSPKTTREEKIAEILTARSYIK